MIKDQKQRETVALVRNKLYRTFQFHGIVGKGKNPELVFKTVISQIFLWLRDRFRQFEEIPEQILLLSDIDSGAISSRIFNSQQCKLGRADIILTTI